MLLKEINEAADKLWKTTKTAVTSLPLDKLLKLLDSWDEWFNVDGEYTDDIKKLKEENNKNKIVAWIMETDPIFVEGGLLDFLHQNNVTSKKELK